MSKPIDPPQSPKACDDAADRRPPHGLERDGKPEVVVIPYAAHLRLQEAQKSEILGKFDSLLRRLDEQNAAYSEEEVAADVEKARGG